LWRAFLFLWTAPGQQAVSCHIAPRRRQNCADIFDIISLTYRLSAEICRVERSRITGAENRADFPLFAPRYAS
jgi:hypothetical protein